MGAPSTYKQLMEARRVIQELQKLLIEERQKVEYMKGFTLRQAMDIAMITNNSEFGFGPVYNERWEEKFMQHFLDYAQMCVDDAADDEDLWFTKDKLDGALQRARGTILPFEERYAYENLYFRDKDLKEKTSAEQNLFDGPADP